MGRGKRETAEVLLSNVFTVEFKKWPHLCQQILDSGDTEPVHDLRVSMRKVRTAIKVLGTALPSKFVELDQPLRMLFHLLGDVRKFDVAIIQTSKFKRGSRREVQDRLVQLRLEARQKATAALERRSALDDLTELGTPTLPDLDIAVLLKKTHAKAASSLKRIEREWELSEVHRLRRRLKRLRYTVEFLQPALGKPALIYGHRLEKLQDRLGTVMDGAALARTVLTLDGLTGVAAQACLAQLRALDNKVTAQKSHVIASRKQLSGKAWKDLRRRFV